MIYPVVLPSPDRKVGASGAHVPRRSWPRSWLLLALVAVTGVTASATTRVVRLNAPALAAPGSTINATVFASTDATDGEYILFFHVECSIDNGKTWTGVYYDMNVGQTATRIATFKAGAVGTKALVRVRVAYRGGKNGDVDCNGAPINWDGTWEHWEGTGVKSSRTMVMDH